MPTAGWVALLLWACACSFEGAPAAPGAAIDASPDVAVFDAALGCATDDRYGVGLVRLRLADDAALSWDLARTACEADGAHLAVLLNVGERNVANLLSPAARTWIGLRGADRLTWTWVTGESQPTTPGMEPWGNEDKPDRGPPEQGCGAINEAGRFDDEPCANQELYLCQCPQ